MTLEKALQIFQRTELAKQRRIAKYAPYKGGFVLVDDSSVLGCHQYFVTSEGRIGCFYPTMEEFENSLDNLKPLPLDLRKHRK